MLKSGLISADTETGIYCVLYLKAVELNRTQLPEA